MADIHTNIIDNKRVVLSILQYIHCIIVAFFKVLKIDISTPDFKNEIILFNALYFQNQRYHLGNCPFALSYKVTWLNVVPRGLIED